MMGTFAVLLTLTCLTYGVQGNTIMCRSCHNLVRGPTECTTVHRCHETCVTDVYLVQGETWFRYDCGHPDECDHNNHHPHHNYGQMMCRQCCYQSDCQQTACSQYLTTIPAPHITPAPTGTAATKATTAPHVTTPAFQINPGAPGHTKMCRSCHHLVRGPGECTVFNHCHEACITDVFLDQGQYWFRYDCGKPDECDHNHNHHHNYGQMTCRQCCYDSVCQQNACPQFLTTSPAPTTTAAPTTTTTPIVTAIPHQNATQTQTCVDNDDPIFTCADMTFFGYCLPNAGAGYALAQKRCRKTCGFCP